MDAGLLYFGKRFRKSAIAGLRICKTEFVLRKKVPGTCMLSNDMLGERSLGTCSGKRTQWDGFNMELRPERLRVCVMIHWHEEGLRP